jgi:hypothetical protein
MNKDKFSGTTIVEAHNFMRPRLKEGVACPCCYQPVKLYKRPLSSSMAYGLILINKEFNENNDIQLQWLHLEEFFKNIKDLPSSVRGDVPKLRFWGLIEPSSECMGDGNPNSGLYRITDLGRKFAEGKVLLQSSVKLYNNKFYGFAGPEIDIFGALKNKFKYDEIVNKVSPTSHVFYSFY